MNEATALGLIDRIYEAAMEPAAWSQVIDELKTAYRAAAVNVQFRFAGPPAETRVYGCGFDPKKLAEYPAYWVHRDPWAAFTALPAGTITLTAEKQPRSELERTEAFHDFLTPQGFTGDGLVAMMDPGTKPGSPGALVGILRGPDSPEYGPREVAFTRVLMPHLVRAYQVTSRLTAVAALQGTVQAALDRVSTAVLLLDAERRPLVTNRAFDELVHAGDGLTLGVDGLRANTPSVTRAIRAAVVQCHAREGRVVSGAPGAVRVARPSGAPPYAVVVAPLRAGHGAFGEARAATMVLVFDPRRDAGPPDAVLRRVFGLTPAEARLAVLIASGHSPRAAAGVLGVSWNTVRSQLKAVYAKTGTDRQASLASLLTRLSLFDAAGG